MQSLLDREDELTATIRHNAARAGAVKDPEKAREAAFKAWRTMRRRAREAERLKFQGLGLERFLETRFTVPASVRVGKYRINPPLVKSSKLTYVEKGGVGKQLSDGWVVNFAVGCTHGCVFCYVDEIHKKFGERRAGPIVYEKWGDYFAVPENIEEAIEATPWEKWKGVEVMLSSTHDAYLPQLIRWTRRILEKALPDGVKFCIQTRSPLVERDFGLLSEFRGQVRLQVSVATSSPDFARLIEPRVVTPERRFEILRRAKDAGLTTGIILAPIFPDNPRRKNYGSDMRALFSRLAELRPDHIYGESVHVRGVNLAAIEEVIGERLRLWGFDREAESLFKRQLRYYNLQGIWWPEH